MDQAETVALKCDQALQCLADDRLLTVTPASLGGLCDKIEERLREEIVEQVYTQGFDGSDACRGLHLLERLRNLQRKLAGVKLLVSAMHATPENNPTAEALRAGLRFAQEAGVQPAHKLLTEMIVERRIAEHIKAGDYAASAPNFEWADHENITVCTDIEPCLKGFARDDAKPVQKRYQTLQCGVHFVVTARVALST